MTQQPTDGALVAALLGGDHAALGHIYDRYADRLYDTAAAMLRDRDEAADVVQEVFLVAAQKLGQLREPERLKAWLFAVLRNEVYLRTRRRGRTRPTDFTLPGAGEMSAPSHPHADAADIERQELAELVRAAAAGLDERDQLVLELHLRQDLSGDDLAAAVGVTTSQAHVLVHRMRDRLARSLGAVTVARAGRDDCPDLSELLAGWDGTFSVLIRKRVARHVDRCEICDETRSRHGALALFGAAPALAAPADLRDAVLASASRAMAPRHEHDLDPDGFPRPLRSTRRPPGWRGLAAVAAVLVVVALVAGLAVTRDGGGTADVAAADTTTTGTSASGTGSTTATEPADMSASDDTSGSSTSDVPGSTTTPSTTAPVTSSVPTPGGPPTSPTGSSISTTTAPTTTAPTTTSTTTSAPVPGDVVISTSLIDLGESERSGSLGLSNPGDEAVNWALAGDGASPFAWSTLSGTVGPGESVAVQVSIDRSRLAEGTVVADFTVSGGASGSTPVQVRARVERPPQVAISFGPSTMSCSSRSQAVVADVTDESTIASVELRWSGPGAPGRTTMTAISTTQWEGAVEPDAVDGTWTYTVVATDSRGNMASDSGQVILRGCTTTTTRGFATP